MSTAPDRWGEWPPTLSSHTLGRGPQAGRGAGGSPLKPYPDSELWMLPPGLRGHDLGPDTAPEPMKGGTGPGGLGPGAWESHGKAGFSSECQSGSHPSQLVRNEVGCSWGGELPICGVVQAVPDSRKDFLHQIEVLEGTQYWFLSIVAIQRLCVFIIDFSFTHSANTSRLLCARPSPGHRVKVNELDS